jgi:formiminotetrahydrofolate cyclodeaminase
MTDVEYRSEPLERFLEDLAAGTSTPGGGAVAAMATAMAAGLVAMVARFSTGVLTPAADVADKADELRRRATLLAEEDARAYGAVKAAYAIPKGTDGRPEQIRTALEGATEVPLQVAALAAEIAALAAVLLEGGNRNLQGDAVTAVFLAAAAARSAAILVEGNVALGRLDPSLSAQAQAYVAAVAELEYAS